MPRASVSLLALLLVAALAPAHAGTISVSTAVDGASLSLHVTTPGSVNTTVVVTHDDPLLGPVVDRVTTVAVQDGATVKLLGLPPGANLSVRLLDANLTLPPLDPAGEPNASALLQLPTIQIVDAPVSLPAGGNHTFPAYPVPVPYGACLCGLLVTDAGRLVVWGDERSGTNLQPIDRIVALVSSDGGHTFSPPVRLDPSNDSEQSNDPLATVDGEEVTFLFGDHHLDGSWSGTGVTRLDASTMHTGFQLMADAPIMTMTSAARLGGSDPFVLVPRQGGEAEPGQYPFVSFDIFHVAPAGYVDLYASARPPVPVPVGVLTLLGGATGGLAIAYVEHDNITVLRSLDRGASWQATTVAVPDVTGMYNRVDAQMDPSGTVHVLARGLHPEPTAAGGGTYENKSLYYARFPLAGPATLTPIDGDVPGAIAPGSDRADSPLIAVHGSRVWILWTNVMYQDDSLSVGGEWALQSVDAGLTFGDAFRLHVTGDRLVNSGRSLGQSPGGRPTLLGWPEGGFDLSVMPLFDPVPELATQLVQVVGGGTPSMTRIAPSPTAPTPAPTPVTQTPTPPTSAPTTTPPASPTPVLPSPAPAPTATPPAPDVTAPPSPVPSTRAVPLATAAPLAALALAALVARRRVAKP